jgi:hypothetical protein
MRTSSTKNSLIIGISIVLGASLLSVGVSNAAGTSIKACAKKSNGAMRLIDVKKKCKKSERTLTWGTKGTTGAKGVAGARGAAGTNGTNGVSSVLVKSIVTSEISHNSPSAALSAEVPIGKYNFQFSSELGYFNNNVATLKTRFLKCLITTNFDGPTAMSAGYANEVLWPRVGQVGVIRTSFAPSNASTAIVSTQTFSISGVLDVTSDTTIYLQCQNEFQTGDNSSTGQLAKFIYPTFTLVKTNEIVNVS